MSAKTHADRLSRALSMANLFETVESSTEENQLTLLGRVSKESRPRWDRFMTSLMTAETGFQEADQVFWRSHFCQRYLLKNGRLVYGWNVALRASDLGSALDVIMPLIKGEETSSVLPAPTSSGASKHPLYTKKIIPTEGADIEVETGPLPGAFGERRPNESGKGGYLIGSKDGSKNFRPPVRR